MSQNIIPTLKILETSKLSELTSPSFCSFMCISSGCRLSLQALCWTLPFTRRNQNGPTSGFPAGRGGAWPAHIPLLQNAPRAHVLIWGSAVGNDSKTFVFLFPEYPVCVHNCSRASFRTKLRHKLLTKQLARVRSSNQSIQQSFNSSSWSDLEQHAENSVSDREPSDISLDSWSQSTLTSLQHKIPLLKMRKLKSLDQDVDTKYSRKQNQRPSRMLNHGNSFKA